MAGIRTDRVSQQRDRREQIWRAAAATGAAVATVPYVALKVAWLAGSQIGVRETGLMDTVTLRIANATTLLLDLTVVWLAFLLGSHIGRPLQSWLWVPMWAATGLLASPVLLAVGGLALGGPSVTRDPDDGLEPWVYLVVYGGFALQGAFLALAFALLAPRLWRQDIDILAKPTRLGDGWATAHVAVVCRLALAALLACGAIGFITLASTGQGTYADQLSWSVAAATCLVTSTGILWFRRGLGRMPALGRALPLWVGSAGCVMWGTYSRFVVAPLNSAPVASLRLWEAQILGGSLTALLCGLIVHADRGRRISSGGRLPSL